MRHRNPLVSQAYGDLMMAALIREMGTTIGGRWTIDNDSGTGAWLFYSGEGHEGDIAIYATAFWDEEPAISMQVSDWRGDAPSHIDSQIDFMPSGDLLTDARRYASLVIPMLAIMSQSKDRESAQRPSLLECAECNAIETPEQIENQGGLCKCGAATWEIAEHA